MLTTSFELTCETSFVDSFNVHVIIGTKDGVLVFSDYFERLVLLKSENAIQSLTDHVESAGLAFENSVIAYFDVKANQLCLKRKWMDLKTSELNTQSDFCGSTAYFDMEGPW